MLYLLSFNNIEQDVDKHAGVDKKHYQDGSKEPQKFAQVIVEQTRSKLLRITDVRTTIVTSLTCYQILDEQLSTCPPPTL